MATKAETKQHPMIVGLGEWYSNAIGILVKASNVIAVPMFWHMGCLYKEKGYDGFKKYHDKIYFAQLARTVVPWIITMAGFSNAHQPLFALGGGFLTGTLLDWTISSLLVTGIKKQNHIQE